MAGGDRPIIDPLLTDAVCAVYQILARLLPVLHDQDDPGVECSLGMIDVGLARPFVRDYILNPNLGSLSLEYGMAVGIVAGLHQILQYEEIGDLGWRNQSHEIKI